MMQGLTLDAGALIALERNDRRVVLLIDLARKREAELVIPAGVLGQVWRDGRTQVRLARFLRTPDLVVEPLDNDLARAAGQLCGMRGTTDVIDASVVLCARARRHLIVTSDPDDLAHLDPRAQLITIS
jgi:hypothetical protein